MCDYSLQSVRSRPAKVGDKLTTRYFGTGTRGFAAVEDAREAVCVLPGTELAFSSAVAITFPRFLARWKVEKLAHATAIFRQVPAQPTTATEAVAQKRIAYVDAG